MNPIFKPVRAMADKVQEVLKVLLTEPDADKMEYFAAILDELKELAQFYALNFPEFVESVRQKTAQVSYGQGGDCVHRGILCPSPVLNMIAGCNKGVPLPSADAATDNYYKYSFDKEKKLISVSHYDFQSSKIMPDTVEFIVRRDNVEYGITFNSSWREVSKISKSVFRNGWLENYAVAEYDDSTPDQMYLHYEEYIFEDGAPVQADVYFGISPELDMYNLDTFYLSYDSGQALHSAGADSAGSMDPALQASSEGPADPV